MFAVEFEEHARNPPTFYAAFHLPGPECHPALLFILALAALL
jgi:hypothetical protein